MNIQGKKVLLRAIEETDVEQLHRWANDPEIQQWLVDNHLPTNMEDQKKWFSSLSVNSPNQRFAIEYPNLGLIGIANLVGIDWVNRRAVHGIMLGDKEIRGKGIGVDVVMAIMRYAFDQLGLNRLDSSMIEYNDASIKMYCEKCGWKKEGWKKEYTYRKGRFWNLLFVGITRSEYNAFVETTNYWDL